MIVFFVNNFKVCFIRAAFIVMIIKDSICGCDVDSVKCMLCKILHESIKRRKIFLK